MMRANGMHSSTYYLAVSARSIPVVAALAATACASIPPGRAAVDSVQILGARHLDPRDVTDKLATAGSPKFAGVFSGVVYPYEIFDGSTLQRDVARVERTYQAKGFLEAHARAARVIHASPDHVRVEIAVDEGPPTVNRRVVVEGLDGVPKPVADAARSAASDALPPGARFDEIAYKNAQSAILRALTDRGYAYATLRADAETNLGSHVVDYSFTAVPGLLTTFGTIEIVGLDPDAEGPRPQEIGEAQLRRTMHIHAGEPFSTTAIDSATQALLDLEVFSAVQIVPALSDPSRPVVPLTVRVEPTKLRVLRIGGGFELDEIKTELHALVGWEDHNFLGDLRDFSVELKPGAVLFPTRIDNFVPPDHVRVLPEERLQIQFRQPGFIDPRTTVFLRPEINVYPLLVVPDPDPSQPVVGYIEPKGVIGLERRFGKHFFASIGENVQGEIPFKYTTSIDPHLPNILLSYPQLLTTFDLRDDPVHPHAGMYASNDLQVAGGPLFGGTAADVRIQPEVRGYVPIARGITFAARGAIGFLFASNYGDYVKNGQPAGTPLDQVDRDIEILYFRGFFSGGPSSNRGFPPRGIAPHGSVPFLNPANASAQVALNCAPGVAGTSFGTSLCSVPIGGFSLWEASAEMRFDVAGPVGMAVFCDSGDVSAHQAGFPKTLRPHLSCGAGGRYDTPVGAIRLDIGYRIQPLQVLGFPSETAAAAVDPTEGTQPTLLGPPGTGLPVAISFGIGEAF
jgi:outer membrane protein insertion porin family/translocation and assembly module TamA